MTAETEIRPRRSALATARAWQAIDLGPELRRGVEAAARSSGMEPEAWLTRIVLEAANATALAKPEAPPSLEKPTTEVARSLALLLSAARARSRERQAEASALTLVEPAPAEEAPPRQETAPPIRLTAVRPEQEPARQLPTLYLAQPQPRRHVLAFALLAITVVAAFGAGAFYIRYGGAAPAEQPALTAALPPTPPTPKPDGAAAAAPTPAPATATNAPATATNATATNAPATATSAPAPPPAQGPAPAPEPATAAAVPAVQPPSAPPAPQTTPAAAPASEPTAVAPPPSPPPAPPAADAQTAATETAQPAPPAASTAAALPPGVGPRVQPPPQPPEVVINDYNLGVRYAFGTGVKQDYKKAAELFLKAAMQGLPDAQYNLGALYDNGLGVPKDPVRAVIWYHSAAEQSHPSAQLNLGLAYANGTGVAQDYAESARWFRRAADQGVVTAQYNLAALYANGRGVEQSNVDAYAWFDIAAASGDLEARDQMKRAADIMTPLQLKAARALAVKLADGVKRPIAGSSPNPQVASAASAASTASAASAETTAAAPAAPAASSALAQPVDKAQVTEIQRYLARLQFDPGPANGVLSDKTTEAIRQYQTDRKLKVDGDASRSLLFHLKAEVERLQKP
jgi:hypothetical protein